LTQSVKPPEQLEDVIGVGDRSDALAGELEEDLARGDRWRLDGE
jgi:hypothetical protein